MSLYPKASYTLTQAKSWLYMIDRPTAESTWQLLTLTYRQTASVISDMKSLRISGLTLPIESMVQNLRLEELRVGGRFRMVLTYSIVIAFAPFFISPVLVGQYSLRHGAPRYGQSMNCEMLALRPDYLFFLDRVLTLTV